jgi:hypothetical protein
MSNLLPLFNQIQICHSLLKVISVLNIIQRNEVKIIFLIELYALDKLKMKT